MHSFAAVSITVFADSERYGKSAMMPWFEIMV